MELTRSEIRTVQRVRLSLRRKALIGWVLGIASVALIAFAAFETIILATHLRKHGIPMSGLLSALEQARLPGGVQAGFVLASAVLILLTLIAGLNSAIALLVFLRTRQKESSLLLRLVDECTRRSDNRSVSRL